MRRVSVVGNSGSGKSTLGIVAWSWTRHGVYRERYGRAQDDPAWSEVEFIRVRRPRDARLLLAAAVPPE